MTHLYSGMQTVTRRNALRYAGAVEAAFLIDDMDNRDHCRRYPPS